MLGRPGSVREQSSVHYPIHLSTCPPIPSHPILSYLALPCLPLRRSGCARARKPEKKETLIVWLLPPIPGSLFPILPRHPALPSSFGSSLPSCLLCLLSNFLLFFFVFISSLLFYKLSSSSTLTLITITTTHHYSRDTILTHIIQESILAVATSGSAITLPANTVGAYIRVGHPPPASTPPSTSQSHTSNKLNTSSNSI